MCDYISFCARVDGAIAHVKENSHSGAVAAAGWRENDLVRNNRFVEVEWKNPAGKFPGVQAVTRGETNEKQAKAIELFFR